MWWYFWSATLERRGRLEIDTENLGSGLTMSRGRSFQADEAAIVNWWAGKSREYGRLSWNVLVCVRGKSKILVAGHEFEWYSTWNKKECLKVGVMLYIRSISVPTD